MLASKIATFNKLEFLTLLAGYKSKENTARKEYFNIGHPIENPPTLRGSIVIEFNINFLFDNHNHFEYGSPVDMGSLNAGHIKTRDELAFDFKMNFNDFSKMLIEISKAGANDIKEFHSHRITNRVKQAIESMLGLEAADFICNDKSQHARIFEFCLNQGFAVHESHVETIYIPNTYTDNRIIKLISKRFPDEIMTFNPKYGFENRHVA